MAGKLRKPPVLPFFEFHLTRFQVENAELIFYRKTFFRQVHAQLPVGLFIFHQQRFLELAKALAGQPRLLLLDEVMAGLNETELAASVDIVRRVRDELGTTIVWVEHVMSAVIQLADRAIVLNFGEILTEGAPEAVMRHPDVVDAYLGTHAA